MKLLRAWLIVSLLLAGWPLRAVTTNDLATAKSEGRELARQLRETRPEVNFTNSGTLEIRASGKQRRTLHFNSRVVVTGTNWTSFYQAMDGTNELSTISVEHRSDAPNHYRLDHTNLLAASQTTLPFAGSDFWLTDLGLEFLHWPVQLLTRREIKRSNACSVLESRNPSPPPDGYSRIVSWIDNDTGGILLAKAYDANGKRLKEFRPIDFEKVNGQWQLKSMEMENVQTNSRTTLTFDLESK
jgi:Outer membrane lipoprotein-sorting protein